MGTKATEGNSQATTNEQKKSLAESKKSGANASGSTASGTSSIDNHPFARGSVIEVLYGVKEADPESEANETKKRKSVFWWSDSESDEDDAMETDEKDNKMEEEKKEDEDKEQPTSVRLCDIIDRASDGEGKWRYYVHYRDFNRRMDEWIGMDRIVSPPSIGNSKARALKKQEEKQKRKQAKMDDKGSASEHAATSGAGGPGRGNRRRSEADMGGPETDTPRMTRRQRRKSTVADDATVVASNQGGEKGPASPQQPTSISFPATDKEVVKIATSAAAETKVGQHVIATIPAQELDEHEGLDEASLREHEEVTKVKNCAFLELGEFQMETWYFSPLPKELLSEKGFIEVLYVCEFSFQMFARKSELLRYQARELPKNQRHPPGNEIYRCKNLSMFEVDGYEERIYCQNLCYIAKLFLDHKTLYFDVDPFLFYVLCEVDHRGFHPVGYFSKEKYSDVGYNLACILTFPSHQRKGYGRFLIAFSYELSKKEEKVGSPEKPMSDLGQQAYKPFWTSTIVDFLLNHSNGSNSMSIMDISKKTSIMAEDIVFTLNQLGILKIINGVYFIAAEQGLLERLAKKHPVKNPRVDPTKLHWTPFVQGL